MTNHTRRDFLSRTGVTVAGAVMAGSAVSAEAAASAAGLSSAMPRRPLGKTGWLVSIVGFGGGSQFLSQQDSSVVEAMIQRAVDLGVNYFDTAFNYGKNRESYKRYAQYLVPKHRKNVRIAAKLQERGADAVKRDFEITLKELGTDYVDVLHFHALASKEDVDKILAPDGAAKVFRQLKDQGVVKAIGVTGHVSGDLMVEAIRRIEPDCVMCPMNPAHSGDLSGAGFAKVVPFALERGMGVIAMKTTARKGLIGRNGVTADQLVRYALNLPVAAAVIGMPSVEVLESCASIARDLHPITEKDKSSLEDKLAGAAKDGVIPYLACGYADGHSCESRTV